MGKIILKNKLTNEIIEIEGKILSITQENWDILKDTKEKNGSVKNRANGDGSFYYSEKLQKWIGQIQPPNGGKRITITQRKNETKTACKKRYDDTKAKINTGTYVEKSNDTLYEIIKRYINQKLKDNSICANSYNRDLQTLSQLEKTCSEFIHIPIQKVVVEMIEDAKEEIREYSKSSIDKQWRFLKKGFKIALSRRKITFNIMDDETLKKPISIHKQEKKEALTIKQEERLRYILNHEEKDHKYRNIVMMQLNTGMRIGEVLARSLDDFNIQENSFHIHNTLTRDEDGNVILGEHTKIYDKETGIDRGERKILLDNDTLNTILKTKQSKLTNMHNLIFWDYENNCFVSHTEVNSWLDRLNTKYNISEKRLSSHTLRRTRITRLREADVSLPVIQYLVGHVEGSNITDAVYTTVSLDFVSNELKKMHVGNA